MDPRRGHRDLADRRGPLARRLRRPVRRAGPVRAGRRPHRPGGHRLAGRPRPSLARRGPVRRDRHVHDLQVGDPPGPAAGHPGRGPPPPGAAGEPDPHRGPPPGHRDPPRPGAAARATASGTCTTGSPAPRPGGAASTSTLSSTSCPTCPGRSARRSPLRGTPRKTSWTCLPPPGPARTGNRSAICCTGSTADAPTPTFPNCSAWPQPSRHGGQRSLRSCTRGSPTSAPKAPTGSSRPSPATPTASATPATSAYAPAARPPVEPVDTSMLANFVEPAPCNRVG